MGCPCMDPVSGEIKEVSAKTKEMIYRMQNPDMQDAIFRDKQKQYIICNDVKREQLNNKIKTIICNGGK